MLVTGSPGAGKSVFAISLAREIHALFTRDQSRYPAPFFIWFSTERPSILEDLIGVTLQDLSVTDLTVDAVKFLLSQGQIVFIIDGFDEISRALAHQAGETIEKLGAEINGRTNGRLILTSRPAFLVHETVLLYLTAACEEDKPAQREIAPYTDKQQHDWVTQNAPDRPEARPPERHWQRVQTAFAQDVRLRDLCRIPVYLRMLSEVLVREKSVQSRDDLIGKFCSGMWERERTKRKLALSDAQYLLAYEAISVAIVDSGGIVSTELREWLELYLGEDAEALLAELPEDTDTLIRDLAIGPLTGSREQFAFEHEILTGYFFARLLARTLKERGRRINELWNREIYGPAWEFLRDAVDEAYGPSLDKEQLLRELIPKYQSALMLWNLARAIGGTLPRDLFKGKEVAGVVFEDENEDATLDFRTMVFDECGMHDATFFRCNLADASFRRIRIGHMKFVECTPGAIFDAKPIITDDAEVVLVQGRNQGEETYTGDDIRRALTVLSAAERKIVPLPRNMAEQALVIILKSLFKVDGRRLDYPEPRKIENRLRAWLTGYELDEDEAASYLRIFMALFEALEGKNWIYRNPNRPRTRVPDQSRSPAIRQIIHSNAIPIHEEELRNIAFDFQHRIENVAST